MISKFNTILIEVPASLLVETAELVLKSIGKYSRPRIAKKTKKGETRLTFPNFKTYSQTTTVKTAWLCQEGGRGDQGEGACKQNLAVGQLTYTPGTGHPEVNG